MKNKLYRKTQDILSSNSHVLILLAVMIVAMLARLWGFPDIPGGLNQDEAAIGYDAYATLKYGMDRNGSHLPVQLISWGSGQNALYMYLTIPFVYFFGLTIFSIRAVNVIFSIASIYFMYLLVKETAGKKEALWAAFLTAICPWAIMSGRWGLESNLMPNLMLIAAYLWMRGRNQKSTACFCGAAIMLALTMYAYSAIIIIMPLFLICAVGVGLWQRDITVRQVFIAGCVFALIALPIALFFIINIWQLPEVVTPFMTIPRLSSLRSVFSPGEFLNNTKAFMRLIITQNDGLLWNAIPGHGMVYMYMMPLAIGIALLRREASDWVMSIWLICSVVLGCLIEVNINRINLIVFPIVYFGALGLHKLSDMGKKVRIYLIALLCMSFVFFCGDYFKGDHGRLIPYYFNRSLGEAIQYATEITDDTIYLPDVNGVEAIALFYTKMPPQSFKDTVVYRVPDGEFRFPSSFDRFVVSKEYVKGKVAVLWNYGEEIANAEVIRAYEYFSVVK